MAIPVAWLDELRSRLTLSAVIGRTTRVTKAGREFKACCPFHNEKTPSFTINDEKGFYHCFGCGAHGDVIRWMTEGRGLGFIDAIKELAEEAGLEVPQPDPRTARLAAQQAEQRATLHDVAAAAQAWFVGQLASAEGAAARAYLATRGFSPATIAQFGFGYAPNGRQALKQALAPFADPLLVEAGLRIALPDKEPYDRFRGRLMLPICDARGRVIGFGGRILDAGKSDAPKYLNSPDTPLFDKGLTLYNLHRAGPIARQRGRLIVVEGYMDAIALANAGIGEVVAPLGTALTEAQLGLLWRLNPAPILCFDGDAAGARAAVRAALRALPLLRPGHTLTIARLPAGQDPDDVVRARGAAGVEAALGGAVSLAEALWQHERDAVPLTTPEAKAGLKARLLAHIATIADRDIQALYRREWLQRFSAFAFPPPRERRLPGGKGNRATLMSPSAHIPRLVHAVSGGAQDHLMTAIVCGLVRWPGEIASNADALASLARHDWRIDALLGAFESGVPLEKPALRTILTAKGFDPALEDDQRRLRLPFLQADADPHLAIAALRGAISLLVEQPALEAALRAAMARYEKDVCEEARLEHDRLRKRKLDFDAQFGQMAGRERHDAGRAPPPDQHAFQLNGDERNG